MNLYGLHTPLGYYYVVAPDPTMAVSKFLKTLEEADYGRSADRKVTKIDILASEARDNKFLTGHFLQICKENN